MAGQELESDYLNDLLRTATAILPPQASETVSLLQKQQPKQPFEFVKWSAPYFAKKKKRLREKKG